jgi:hypothetical protein
MTVAWPSITCRESYITTLIADAALSRSAVIIDNRHVASPSTHLASGDAGAPP